MGPHNGGDATKNIVDLYFILGTTSWGGPQKKTTISLFRDVTVCNRWYFLLNFQVSGKITPPNSCFVGFPINRLCIPFWFTTKNIMPRTTWKTYCCRPKILFQLMCLHEWLFTHLCSIWKFRNPEVRVTQSESSSQSHPVIHVEYESVELAFNIIQCIRLCVQLVVHTIHIRLCSWSLGTITFGKSKQNPTEI